MPDNEHIRSYFYYISKKNDAPVEKAIREAAEFGDGFDKIYQRLRKAGYTWNHKKVYRVYRKIHFNKRCRLKKRLPQRVKVPLEAPEKPNVTWSMDFVSDKTESGRTFRVLNIIDDCNREAVAQEAYMSITAERVLNWRMPFHPTESQTASELTMDQSLYRTN